MDRLGVFKVLGDNTRYAIYLELARSGVPLSTAAISEVLELHPNTVRPHLERMREVGLVDVEIVTKGTVGRPQHRFFLAADAPSLGLEPSSTRLMAGLLATLAASKHPTADEVAAIAHPSGQAWAPPRASGKSCVQGLMGALADLGFDPASADDGRNVSIAFTHCPFRDLAEIFPELVCNLHRGMVEGFVEAVGGAEVAGFATLADRDPCHVDLAVN